MTDQSNENNGPDLEEEIGMMPEEEVGAPEFAADTEAFLRLAAENEELKDRSLRVVADMENLRRRTQREIADAKAYAVANFARDMLAVSDNLRRGLDAIPAGAREGDDVALKALIEGVELTERSMMSALERHGVTPVAAQGERFDPNVHQAIYEVPDTSVPNNTVVQVVQTGFMIGDRVLRPAMVGVSRGGPKADAVPAAAAEPGPVDEQAEKDA